MSRAELTARQRRFVEEYGVDRNATAAALRAGFAPASARVTACRLLKANKAVQEAVAAQEALAAAEVAMTRQRVVQGLLEAVEMARERRDPGAMIAAWRELGKMLGFYAPARHAVAVENGDSAADVSKGLQLDRLTDEELARMIECGDPIGKAAKPVVGDTLRYVPPSPSKRPWAARQSGCDSIIGALTSVPGRQA